MIGLIAHIIDENQARQPHPVTLAASSYTWKMVRKLIDNPAEVNVLNRQLTKVYASVPFNEINSWSNKIKAMPEGFYFGCNSVPYRVFVNEGVLMLAECIITPVWDPARKDAEADRRILNAAFIARENRDTQSYEVVSAPTSDARNRLAAKIFSEQFLDMMTTLEINPVKKTPVMPTEKTSWWKKVTGK